LREKGQGLFDLAATPSTVKSILKEPYAVEKAVDDILVDVLLAPLLTEGASDVVFDTLSYSAGPLPEQQLASLAATQSDFPVWVCYGKSDPWTPPARVERLKTFQSVERVVALDGAGHCPHDETPELVNPLLLEFLNRIREVTPS
jgi:pimeloyl-ACP methyl ester carboxylesterase